MNNRCYDAASYISAPEATGIAHAMRALIFFLFIPLTVQSLSYIDNSASTNGTQSIRTCSDVTPWGRFGARYNNPYPNDGSGTTIGNNIPALKWVNGWYQGTPGTSYFQVGNANAPVTYAFWTSTGGRGLWEDGRGCAYHMLAPTWLMLGIGLSFNLEAYGGQDCYFAKVQNTALFTKSQTIPLYTTSTSPTSPVDLVAYGSYYYHPVALKSTTVYDYLPTSTPVDNTLRNLEYRIEHWAIAVNSNTYAVFLNGNQIQFAPGKTGSAPDLTNQFVNWPAPNPAATAYNDPNNMLDFLDFQI